MGVIHFFRILFVVTLSSGYKGTACDLQLYVLLMPPLLFEYYIFLHQPLLGLAGRYEEYIVRKLTKDEDTGGRRALRPDLRPWCPPLFAFAAAIRLEDQAIARSLVGHFYGARIQ